MKHFRALHFAVAVILLLGIASCAAQPANKAHFTATEADLGCTPQELIDYINEAVDFASRNGGSDSLVKIPDYEKPGYLSIGGTSLFADIEVDKNGVLTEITFSSATPNVATVANLTVYINAVAMGYSPDISSYVSEDYARAITDNSSLWPSATYDGVSYLFFAKTGYHLIEIAPAKEAAP